MMSDDLDLLEMDILREIGTTAAGCGTNALFEMVGRKISVELPSLTSICLKDIDLETGQDGRMLSVQCDIVSGLEGRILLTFDEDSALALIRVCYPGQPEIEKDGIKSELALSVLKEVGNVVLCAYINALSEFVKKTIIPTAPSIVRGSLRSVIEAAFSSEQKVYVLMIDTVFEESNKQIKGRMGIILTKQDKEIIRDSCGKILNDLET